MIPERWKRDPLSAFLTFAAVLLLVLYGIEEWRTSVVEDAQVAASKLTAPDSCRYLSTGLRGETLVLQCPAKTISEISETEGDAAFEAFFVVGSDGKKRIR